MRFDELQIPAFGPFTDFSLSLPREKYDIHLIYGPNEAGKSSLLRALRQLLYGIPVRSEDAFLHQYPRLRIGATISEGDESLTFFRKKGKQNTLLDSDGKALPEKVLFPFLGPVDESFFENMFGLDTDSLRRGAGRLLAGEGDLGAAIFSASLGGTPVNEAIKTLEDEANLLFKERSRNTTIAVNLRELKEAEGAEKAETISTARWEKLKAELKEAAHRFEARDRAYRGHLSQSEFLKRCLQALPVLQKVRRLEAELAVIKLPELPSDFAGRVRETMAALASAKHTLALHEERGKSLKSDLGKIADPSGVLEKAADLDLLHRRADRYQGDLETLPDLKTEIRALDARLGEDKDLADYPPINDETLHRWKTASRKRDELAGEASRLAAERDSIGKRLKKAGEALEKLKPSRGLASLRDLVERAEQFSLGKKGLPQELEEQGLLKKQAENFRQRLGIEGDPRSLAVVARATIEDEDRKRLTLQEEIRDLEKELRQCRDELSAEQSALDHLATKAVLYSPEDLQKARDHRDALWEEILASGKPDAVLGAAIASADEIADALHRDAGHLARAAEHRLRLDTMGAREKNLAGDLEKAKEALERWRENWEKSRAFLPGQLPSDLMGWREDWEKFCETSDELEKRELALERLRKEEKVLLEKLGGDDFEHSFRQARTDLEKAMRKDGERDAILKQQAADDLKHEQLQEESAEIEAAVKVARFDWEGLCGSLEISPDLATEVTLGEVESRVTTRMNLLGRNDLQQEVEQKEKFVGDYRELLEKCAGALKAPASEPALFELLEKAKDDRNRGQTLRAQLATLEEEEVKLKLEITQSSGDLEGLLSQAGGGDLELVIAQFENRQGLRKDRASQIDVLEGLAGGVPLEEFRADLDTRDPAGLQEEVAGLTEAGEASQEGRDRAKEAWDDLRREERELREAGDLAAQERQRAADARSALAVNFNRFRQLHHALAFLKEQVERYREQAQGPMVGKTSHFFEKLTGGAFERVVARPDDQDVPRLLALRSSGEEVPTGGLSEGTRDQLYLALRLAAIDLHLENHSPVPLILDDLLMTFDDERTESLLSVLKEFSRKTQILIFTHHRHLIDLIKDPAVIHRLPSTSGGGE